MLPLHLHLNFQKILSCQSTPRRPLFEEGGEQGERALEPEDRARAPLYSQTSAALPSRCAALVKSHSLTDFSLLLCGTGWWFAVRLQECCPKRFCAAPGAQSVWGGCGCFCPCGHQTLSPWCLRKWVFSVSLKPHRSDPVSWPELTEVERFKPLPFLFIFFVNGASPRFLPTFFISSHLGI